MHLRQDDQNKQKGTTHLDRPRTRSCIYMSFTSEFFGGSRTRKHCKVTFMRQDKQVLASHRL